ncbi:class I lanthipeptide [uncultured Aquimarina sp.]|uniref:class I lanthipeptide n=1 Tax=uncultured Aquimarina sp. TaxID=575652 RepID=UPI002623FBC1|nr:class I lanthipeptide [uncultured Aquimarina sp.]
MKTKSKKLQLEKITISKLNKNDLMYFRGGSALANCGDQTKDKNNPNCNQSEGGC